MTRFVRTQFSPLDELLFIFVRTKWRETAHEKNTREYSSDCVRDAERTCHKHIDKIEATMIAVLTNAQNEHVCSMLTVLYWHQEFIFYVFRCVPFHFHFGACIRIIRSVCCLLIHVECVSLFSCLFNSANALGRPPQKNHNCSQRRINSSFLAWSHLTIYYFNHRVIATEQCGRTNLLTNQKWIKENVHEIDGEAHHSLPISVCSRVRSIATQMARSWATTQSGVTTKCIDWRKRQENCNYMIDLVNKCSNIEASQYLLAKGIVNIDWLRACNYVTFSNGFCSLFIGFCRVVLIIWLFLVFCLYFQFIPTAQCTVSV